MWLWLAPTTPMRITGLRRDGDALRELRQEVAVRLDQLVEHGPRDLQIAYQRIVDQRLQRELIAPFERSLRDQLLVDHVRLQRTENTQRQRAHSQRNRSHRAKLGQR